MTNDTIPANTMPMPVPSINRAQLLIWLLVNKGKTEADVDAAIASIEDDQARAVAEIEWRYRPTFEHDHPLLTSLAPLLEIDPADLPDAFREAARL